MRRALTAAAVATAGAALAGGASAVPAMGASSHEPVVMAQIAGGTANADEVAARTGLTLEGTLPQIGWATFAEGGDAAVARLRLLHDPAVTRIDFVAPGERQGLDFIPRDIIFNSPGTVAVDGLGAVDWKWHWTKANFPAAWDITRGSAAVKVVVIDSEFDTEHPDLKTKFATGRNFDSGTTNYRTSNVRAVPGANTTFHGSHVAGLVGAASDNAEGGPGACFDCVVIPYKIGFAGANSTSVDEKFVRDLTEALVAAGDSDGVVINMSLGTSRDHAPLRAAVDYARSKGKIVVASAGNSQLGQQGPAGVPNYPGAYPGVIAVASTRPDDSIAASSTNGDFVDIAAPGDAVLSTWDSRLTVDNSPPENHPTHGVGYKVLSGTSMASPIVAGLAALMKTVRPDLTADEVELLLQRSAVDLGAAGKDPVFGAGRIDAFAALKAAQAYVRPTPPPPPPRTKVRIFYSCEAGAKDVAVGKPARLGVARGVRLVCKGRTAPALRKTRIEVQRFAARGGWKRIARVTTNNKGRFGFTIRLRTVGNWTVRAAFTGSPTLAPAGSVRAKLRVAPRR